MARGSELPPFCSEMGVVGNISFWGSTILTVRQGLLRATFSAWVPRKHDLHINAKHTLPEQHMVHGTANIQLTGSYQQSSLRFPDTTASQPLALMNRGTTIAGLPHSNVSSEFATRRLCLGSGTDHAVIFKQKITVSYND